MITQSRILWLPHGDADERHFDYESGAFSGGLSNRNPAGIRVDPETALRSTVVLACVRVLAEGVAGLPLHLYRRLPGGGKEIAREHPLYRILHTAPNSWQTSFEWREMQMLHLGTHGQSFSEIRPGASGAVSELIPLHPSRMRVERIENGRLRYIYQEEEGGSTTYTQDQVMHIRWLTDDGVNGMVPVELARDAIGLARACEVHGASFFGNGARPGVVLSTEQTISTEAAEHLRSNWERAHRGPDRAGRTAVLTGGLKPIEIGGTNQESQYLETRRFQIEEICRLYRVPPHLVGDLSRSSFSNIEQQSIDFVQHTLLPWLRRFEYAFARDLIVDDEVYFAEFDTRGLMRGDASARASYYSSMYNLGVASINEIRAWENLDPIEGGDLRFVQLNMQTLDDANRKKNEAATAKEKAEPTADLSGLITVLQQVSGGTLKPEAAQALLLAVYPALSADMAARILGGAVGQVVQPTQPTADVNGLLAILGQVSQKVITPESAAAILTSVFPQLPQTTGAEILAGVQAAPAEPPADGVTTAAPEAAAPPVVEEKKLVGDARAESEEQSPKASDQEERSECGGGTKGAPGFQSGNKCAANDGGSATSGDVWGAGKPTSAQLEAAQRVHSAMLDVDHPLGRAADLQMRGGKFKKNGEFVEFTETQKNANTRKIAEELGELRKKDPAGFESARRMSVADHFGYQDYDSMPDKLVVYRGHFEDEKRSAYTNVTSKFDVAAKFGASGVVTRYEVNKADIIFPLANSVFDEGELIVQRKTMKTTGRKYSTAAKLDREFRQFTAGMKPGVSKVKKQVSVYGSGDKPTIRWKTGVVRGIGVGRSLIVTWENGDTDYLVRHRSVQRAD